MDGLNRTGKQGASATGVPYPSGERTPVGGWARRRGETVVAGSAGADTASVTLGADVRRALAAQG